MNYPLVKTLKTVNFMAGKASSLAEIKRHRKQSEWAHGLATPKEDVERRKFRTGKIPCEEIRPVKSYDPGYVILYCHGGGYICGGLGYAGNLAAKLALATGFRVYSFAYRLAPEHPYPAASEDAAAMWKYITENVADAEHVLLAGDSAGGNMALCLTQRLISEGKPAPREVLLFSPIFGSFEKFPPVFIMAGRNGILVDDSIRLKEKIEQAGGTATLDIEEKGWHVYQHVPGALARRAMKRLGAHVSQEINGKR